MKKIPKRSKFKFLNKTKTLNDELVGDKLWHKFSANITPLNHRNRHSEIGAADYFSEKETPVVLKREIRALPQARTKLAYVTLPDFTHGAAAGLDNKSARKMRRGKIKIQARLDLHGMIQTEAHLSLLGFLEHAYEMGKKSVLIITGKGLSRNGEIGVLRQAVPRWLNEKPMKNWIRGFDHAALADGGEGALYVLLRRKR